MDHDEMSDILERIEKIESELTQLRERNKRVEIDKAWENSKFRLAVIIILTYILTAIVFKLIGVRHYLLNALIPTIAYALSTLSLPPLRNYWISKFKKNITNRST
ncbi:MAG: hypothetical protein D6828_01635 [Nitrospirae bacterium]|nr:MAG: hypothetical protein D6828_01635 [Nitrospirota bacterium]